MNELYLSTKQPSQVVRINSTLIRHIIVLMSSITVYSSLMAYKRYDNLFALVFVFLLFPLGSFLKLLRVLLVVIILSIVKSLVGSVIVKINSCVN